jgi:rhodanese-related sulfurtransferase
LIKPEELYRKLSEDRPPVVIDVRGREAYAAGHIPGALHSLRSPGDELAARMAGLPQDRPIVTY